MKIYQFILDIECKDNNDADDLTEVLGKKLRSMGYGYRWEDGTPEEIDDDLSDDEEDE